MVNDEQWQRMNEQTNIESNGIIGADFTTNKQMWKMSKAQRRAFCFEKNRKKAHKIRIKHLDTISADMNKRNQHTHKLLTCTHLNAKHINRFQVIFQVNDSHLNLKWSRIAQRTCHYYKLWHEMKNRRLSRWHQIYALEMPAHSVDSVVVSQWRSNSMWLPSEWEILSNDTSEKGRKSDKKRRSRQVAR